MPEDVSVFDVMHSKLFKMITLSKYYIGEISASVNVSHGIKRWKKPNKREAPWCLKMAVLDLHRIRFYEKIMRVIVLFIVSCTLVGFQTTVNATLQNKPGGMTNYSLVLLRKAAEYSRAVCLDGSPPGYYWKQGWGSGKSRWIIFFEGGGWCKDKEECLARSLTRSGSSKNWSKQKGFDGILSSVSSSNPDFYNWNVVYVKYCDGGSFSGHVKGSVKVQGKRIFFRGNRIYRAVVSDLLSNRGLNHSSHVLLSGCSAGGLAALLQCQHFSDWMPKTTQVKCMADGGFFLDQPDISGKFTLRELFQKVVNLQNSQLGKRCIKRLQQDSWKCFFPEVAIRYITPPVFIVNSFYDTWQISNYFVPKSADPTGSWRSCSNFLKPVCSHGQMKRLSGYRGQMMKALKPVLNSAGAGTFLVSCLSHCQTQMPSMWNNKTGPLLKKSSRNKKEIGKTIASTVGDWFFGRRVAKLMDCRYPCNPTCPAI